MATTSLNVNGKAVSVTVDDPDTPLLYVLRNDLGLHGPRFGCGLGQCGACTVHVDGNGRPLLRDAGLDGCGQEDRHARGAGHAEASPHPLQPAFIDEQAVQCGYCINGMIMQSAAPPAREQPKPSEHEIKSALAENLCRCGTHLRIVRAVKRAADTAREGGVTMNEHAPRLARALSEDRRRARRRLSACGDRGIAPTRGGCRRKDRCRRSRSTASLRIDADGRVTVYSGKVDLGTGRATAMAQIAAEELDVPLDRVTVIQGDTALTPDQGVTCGSLSIQSGGMQIRQAAATARQALLVAAAPAQLGRDSARRCRSGTASSRRERRQRRAATRSSSAASDFALDDRHEGAASRSRRSTRIVGKPIAAHRHPRQGDRPLHVHAGFQAARGCCTAASCVRRDRARSSLQSWTNFDAQAFPAS